MARQSTKSNSSRTSRKSSSKGRSGSSGTSRKTSGGRSSETNGRRASQKTEKYRFAQNLEGRETPAEREYLAYASSHEADGGEDPDVLLAVPVVKVDKIHLQLEELDAHVALQAKVLDLVNLNVGVDAHLGKLRVDIEGVEAQALLKVRLDHVAAIIDRVLTTLDRNPELMQSLGRTVEQVGAGAGDAVGEAGDAVEQVGEGAGEAVGEIGEGAGQAVGDVGEGAGQAVGQIGEGAGEAAGQLGEGAGQAAGQIGEGAGQAVGNVDQLAGNLGQAAGQLGEGAGQAVGGVGQAAGQLGQGAGQAAGQLGEAAGGLGGAVGQLGQGAAGNGDGGGGGADEDAAAGITAPKLAKEAAKLAAREIGSAASDEAKDIGLAAARKVKALGDRRRQRRAEKHDATEAALRTAEELGIDLDEVEGTGADGRITIRDVKQAAPV